MTAIALKKPSEQIVPELVGGPGIRKGPQEPVDENLSFARPLFDYVVGRAESKKIGLDPKLYDRESWNRHRGILIPEGDMMNTAHTLRTELKLSSDAKVPVMLFPHAMFTDELPQRIDLRCLMRRSRGPKTVFLHYLRIGPLRQLPDRWTKQDTFQPLSFELRAVTILYAVALGFPYPKGIVELTEHEDELAGLRFDGTAVTRCRANDATHRI